jgi:hypothetical protein
MKGEYYPVYPDNCMIYGKDRICKRCAAGFYKTTVDNDNGITNLGYGLGVDQCVAKNATHGGCVDNVAGSAALSLNPISFKVITSAA